MAKGSIGSGGSTEVGGDENYFKHSAGAWCIDSV